MLIKPVNSLSVRSLNATTNSTSITATRLLATSVRNRQCSTDYDLAGKAQVHCDAPGDVTTALVVDGELNAVDTSLFTGPVSEENIVQNCQGESYGWNYIYAGGFQTQTNTTLPPSLVLQKSLTCGNTTVGLYNGYTTGDTSATAPALTDDMACLFSKMACPSNVTLPAAPSVTTPAPTASTTAAKSGAQMGSVNKKALILLPLLALAHVLA